MAKKATGVSKHAAPSRVKQIEVEISKYAVLIQESGKTDDIEDELDRLEHEIGELKETGTADAVVKKLKDALDKIK